MPPDDPDPPSRPRRPRRDADAPEPADASETGSIDVQFSMAGMPAAQDDGPAPDDPPASPAEPAPPTLPAARPRRPRGKTVPGFIAESLTNLPVVKEVMPRSRRARVLVRSVIVAFALIAAWIAVIVYLQLREGTKPDFRPRVAAILADLREGKIDEVYARSSTRFQEMVLEETFAGTVEDMNRTLGEFLEVASVIRTEMFRGPSGRTARVELLLDYERGSTRGHMSFLHEDGEWRMLGLAIDIPDELAGAATSDEARAKRVKAPKEVEDLVVRIMEMSQRGEWGEIWDAAAPVFQDSISRKEFVALEEQRREVLGPFKRLLNITRSRQNPSQTGASVDALLEFAGDRGSQTIAGSFKFSKIDGDWKLTFFKVILPMPRAAE